MTAPLVLLVVLIVGLIVSGSVRSCAEVPEVDHGVEILKGSIEQ